MTTPASNTGARSDVRQFGPFREGHGSSRQWNRVINGTPYSFTAVTMPDGERRYFVNRYNGYGQHKGACRCGSEAIHAEYIRNAMMFGCAWSPAHAIIVPPSR